MQESLGVVMPSDQESSDDDVRALPDWYVGDPTPAIQPQGTGSSWLDDHDLVRTHHPAFQPQGSSSSGDPRSSPQGDYIVDDSALFDQTCRPSKSPTVDEMYGPGTRILIQFGFGTPWETRILCERVVRTIWAMNASDGDISCVDLKLKKTQVCQASRFARRTHGVSLTAYDDC